MNRLLVEKMMSIIITMLFIVTPFLGLLLPGNANITILPNGDIIIDNGSIFEINALTVDPLTGELGKYGVDGNLSVLSNGILRVTDATLYFLQDQFHQYWLNVDGGKLQFRNATLTVSSAQLYPYYIFNVTIANSTETYFTNSTIKYPGWFNITNSNITFTKTTFTSLTLSELNETTNDAPSIYISNSTVFLYDARIENMFENPGLLNYFTLVPNAIEKPADTTINSPPDVTNITTTNGVTYNVQPGTNMQIANFTSTGETGTAMNIVLYVRYYTDASYNGTTSLNYSTDGGSTWLPAIS